MVVWVAISHPPRFRAAARDHSIRVYLLRITGARAKALLPFRGNDGCSHAGSKGVGLALAQVVHRGSDNANLVSQRIPREPSHNTSGQLSLARGLPAAALDACSLMPVASHSRRTGFERATHLVSLPEVFDFALEELHSTPSGREQQSALYGQVYGPALDGLAEAPDAHLLSQGTVQVAPVFEDGSEVLDPSNLSVEVREQSAEQIQ